MARHSPESERVALLGGDPGNHPDGQVAFLQDRSLLDMNLAVTQQPPTLPAVILEMVGVAAKSSQ